MSLQLKTEKYILISFGKHTEKPKIGLRCRGGWWAWDWTQFHCMLRSEERAYLLVGSSLFIQSFAQHTRLRLATSQPSLIWRNQHKVWGGRKLTYMGKIILNKKLRLPTNQNYEKSHILLFLANWQKLF